MNTSFYEKKWTFSLIISPPVTHHNEIVDLYWNAFSTIVLLKQRSDYTGICDTHDYVSEHKIQWEHLYQF